MHFKKTINSEHGFTITELLVATLISAVVMTGVYSTFYSQHKAYTVQDQVALTQQNIRAAIQCLESEIRMAGCDPTGDAGAGIVALAPLRITMDITDNAGNPGADGDILDAGEDITYSLSAGNLIKTDNNSAASNILAENIDAIDFVFLDGSAAVTADLSAVRSVQITLVARSAKVIQGYTDTNTYSNQQGTTVYTANDGFRRKRITTEVHCRNLGY
jgi:type IV pilus assembly protein PilW